MSFLVFCSSLSNTNITGAQTTERIAEKFRKAGMDLHKKGKEDSACILLQHALKLFTNQNDILKKADCYSGIGLIMQNKGEYSQALENYIKSENLYKSSISYTLSEGYLSLIIRIGTLYFDQGEYVEADKNFQIALILAKHLKNKPGLILCHLNLGAISEVAENFTDAENYYFQSLGESVNLHDYINTAISLYNIGSIYYKQDSLAKAYRFLTLSLHISDSIEDKEGIASSLNYLGLVHEASGKRVSAMHNYSQALKIYEELGQQKNIAGTLTLIGKNLLESTDKSKAMDYFIHSLEISLRIDAKWKKRSV